MEETISREEAMNGIPGLLEPLDRSLSPRLQETMLDSRLRLSYENLRLSKERDDIFRRAVRHTQATEFP